MATRARADRPSDQGEQELREQEVRRANRELAAYFKGQRTEREARAALKIIKAFIRYRESLDPKSRRPLFPDTPSRPVTKDRATKNRATKKRAAAKIARPRRSRQSPREVSSGTDAQDVVVAAPAPESAAE